MDTKTEARVETIVEDLVEDSKMFTAYDVTKIIRNEVDKNVKIYHSEVRLIVNNMWETMGQFFVDNYYVRTFITVINDSKAFVYHNNMDDICNYDTDALPEEKKSNSQPFDNPINDNDLDKLDDTDNVDSTDDIIMPDNRRRICIPKKSLKAIGLEPGKKVYVHHGNNCVIILDRTLGAYDTPYIVDKSCNVRIGLKLFRQSGMNMFDVKLNGVKLDVGLNSIILRPV